MGRGKHKVKISSYKLQEGEVWVKGYENRYFCLYDGSVFSVLKGNPKQLTGGVIYNKVRNTSTYRILCLTDIHGCNDCKYIHRIIAEAFIPNPENKPQVNHKDLDKQNNHADNLEWATAQENVQHSYDNQVFKRKVYSEQERVLKVDKFIRQGEKSGVSLRMFEKLYKEGDLTRNGIPEEMLQLSKGKSKSYLNLWATLLATFRLVDDNSLKTTHIARVLGLNISIPSRIRNNPELSKDKRDIYKMYVNNPEYVDRHLTLIKSLYNINNKD